MEFEVLGPLRVTEGGAEVPLTRLRERRLLCALALHAGNVVSQTALADALWGDAPPAGERKALQTHVFRLRRRLGDAVVETQRDGYRLAVTSEQVDAVCFERTAAGAAADDLRGLLARWRGRPYDELEDWPPAVLARSRLEEMHAAVREASVVADLTNGTVPVAALETLVNEDPLRERRWMLLMVALYRSGRQAEALRAFERARKLLAAELGLAPGVELARLERAILDHDPRLDAGPPYAWLASAADREPSIRVVEDHATAGRAVLAGGEPDVALARFEAALEEARGVPVDPLTLVDLMLEVGEAAERAGDPRRSVAVAEEAAKLARARDDPLRLARAALTAAGSGWASGLDPHSPVLVLLEEALERLPDAPTHLRARLLARLAAAECHSRPLEDARRHSEEAFALARMLDDPETTAVALYARLIADTDPFHEDANAELAEQLLELGKRHDESRWQAWALSVLPRYDAGGGDIEHAERRFAELAALAERTGDPFAAHQAAYGLLLRPTLEGDYDTAVVAAGQVRDAAARALVDPTAGALAYHAQTAVLRLLQGTADRVDSDPPITWPQSTMAALGQAFRAVACMQWGDLTGAREVLEPIEPAALVELPRDYYWKGMVAMFAMVCWPLRDEARAEVLYELALPQPDVLVVDPGLTFMGAMRHHLGLLAATTGREEATEHLGLALETHRRLGSSEWVRRTEEAMKAVDPVV